MKLARFLSSSSRSLFWGAVVLGLLSGFSSSAVVALIASALTGRQALNLQFVASFVIVLGGVLALDLAAKWTLIRLTTRTNYDLSLDLCDRILATPLQQLEEVGIPRLMAALTDDLTTIAWALGFIPSILINAAILVGCLAYLFWLSPLALLVLSIFGVPAIMGQVYLNRKAKSLMIEGLRWRDQIYVHYRVLTDGIKDLKLHGPKRGAFWDELLEPSLLAIQELLVSTRTLFAMAATWSQTVYFIFILILIILAMIMKTDLRILTGYALVALYMRGSIHAILSTLPQWYNANVALEKLETLGLSLAANSERVDKRNHKTPDSPQIELELLGITHAYRHELEEDTFTLGPLDLILRSGELVFLIGANGSGKTTLMKVITGLYLPEAGAIWLNGEQVTPETVDDYRQHFTAIFSDTYIFDQLLGLSQVDLDSRARASTCTNCSSTAR